METRSIVVHPGAAALRRELGAQAWSALEVLVAISESSELGVAPIAVRALAVELGVSKNAAARALTKLSTAGLVAARQDRTATGTFESGSYRLMVDAAIISVTTANSPHEVPNHTAPPQSRRTANGRHATPAQLSLLDEG